MGQNDSQCFMAETMRSKKATTTMQCRRWDSSRRQPPTCIAEDGNPEGNNLRLGTMKTEPLSEQYETFSIQIQLLQETGYQQQEEWCKSGTMQKYITTRLQDAWQGRTPRQTKKQTSGSILQKQTNNVVQVRHNLSGLLLFIFFCDTQCIEPLLAQTHHMSVVISVNASYSTCGKCNRKRYSYSIFGEVYTEITHFFILLKFKL